MLAPALSDMLSAISRIGFREKPCSYKNYDDKKDNNGNHEASFFRVVCFSFTSGPSYSAVLQCGARLDITCSCLVVAEGRGSRLLLHLRTKK